MSCEQNSVATVDPGGAGGGIDRIERNSSRFIAEAARHERRKRQELLRSLEEPHPDSLITAELSLETWSQGLPAGDHNLLDPSADVPIHWEREKGWQERDA
jgi:hypothetical protein